MGHWSVRALRDYGIFKGVSIMVEVKEIYFTHDFDLVSWVREHKTDIVLYRAVDYGATIFEMANGEVYCIYT